MIDTVLIIKYIYLSILETGFFLLYASDTLENYAESPIEERLTLLYSETTFSITRTLAYIAVCNLIINDNLESLYIFFGLKITLIIFTIFEIGLPGVRIFFLFYMITILLQLSFIIFYYDKIIRTALWKSYKTLGSNPTLQSAYNVRTTMRAARFLFYMYLMARFVVFVLGVGYSSTANRHISPYFYIIPLVESCFCYYEVNESKTLKVISLMMIMWMVVELVFDVIDRVQNFSKIAVSTIFLDLLRAIVYLCCSCLDFYYYGAGLKEYFESRGR